MQQGKFTKTSIRKCYVRCSPFSLPVNCNVRFRPIAVFTVHIRQIISQKLQKQETKGLC